MTEPELDHLVVGVADLASGTAALEAEWDISVGPGGAHPTMATRNRLTRIGSASYLEVIAPDPSAPHPGRPRWFGLDEPETIGRLGRGPALLTWVVRVPDLDRALAQSPVDLGRATAASRGALSWRIAIRDDGAPVEGGTVPGLIEWPDGDGPAASIPGGGLGLVELILIHPEPDRLADILSRLGVRDLATIRSGSRPALEAILAGPGGRTIRLG